MPVPHQIADQPAVVRDLPRPFAIADAGRLHDRLVVPHHIDQTDEAVVQDRELFPAQLIDLGGVAGHG